MNKTYQKILKGAVCLCIVALMLTSALFSGTAQGTSAEDLFDYSSPALGNKQSLSASEVFYRIWGVYPHEAEKNYLDELSGITLRYTDIIPASIVSTNYNSENGTLDVIVPIYTYTASNGVLMTWIPQSASLEGVTKPLSQSNGSYQCQFQDLLYSKDFDIHISFSCRAELPAEAVDLLLTKPYAAGSEALKEIVAYEENYLNPYLEALKKYEVYAAYLQAIEDHKQYLADMKDYEAAKEQYKLYEEEYAIFAEKQKAYEAYMQNKADWEQYYAYQKFLTEDLENYNKYLLYQDTVNKILSKLAILESLFVSDSNKWTFYPSLMGNTVTSVISRKSELIAAGCNEADILMADRATEALRKLMTDYSDLRKKTYASEHERIAALYGYYTAHYSELKDYFAQLYGSLISLYDNEFVVLYADKEGKLARFQQFMGQLYVTATCLDDSEAGIRMENWKISGKSLSKVVEPINLIPDTSSSDPKGVLMPAVEVERVEAVEPIEKPTVTLSPVPKPTAPDFMAKPTEPDFVEEPDTNNPPPAAEHPGPVPAKPPMEETLWELAEAIRAGSVTEREAEGLSRTITLEKTVACPISIHNLKTVTFYDEDGSTVLYQQMVNYGESVTYGGPSLQKSDPYYIYSFKGWILSDGTAAKFDDVRENLSIFADYQKERRTYQITWILDGETLYTYHYYGAMPTSPFSLEKPGSADTVYEFSGWDKEVVAVTGDAVYTGSFSARPRTYTVTWVLGDREITEQVAHGTLPVFPEASPSYSDGVFYYEFLGWDKAIDRPVTADRTFYAKYSKKNLATAGNGAALEVINDGKTITVLAGNSDVFLQNVAKYALSQGLPLAIRWNSFEIIYACQNLNLLIQSACTKVDLSQRTVSGGISHTISYQDDMGKDVDLKLPATLVLFPVEEDGAGCKYAEPSSEGWSDLAAGSYPITGSITLLVKEAHRITVESNEFCNTSALPLYAIPGDWVSIDVDCDFGYEVVGATIIKASGASMVVEGSKFQMPTGGEISIRLHVERIVYHVTFTVDGKVYSQADYFLGDTIVPPSNPVKENDSVYSYSFLEWSPAVTIAMGKDRNPTYAAVFAKNQLNGVDPYHTGHNNNVLINTYLPIFLILAALGVGLLIFLRIRKKKKPVSVTEATNVIEEAEVLEETEVIEDLEITRESEATGENENNQS